MIIRHNEAGQNSIRLLNVRQGQLKKTINHLSSGQRITSAGDDPASFSVSERLRTKTASLEAAKQNGVDGISLLQTAEGYLEGVQGLLSQVKSLAIQASNGILSDGDRNNIQLELNQILQEIDRIKDTAQFNGSSLLDGSFADPATLAGVNIGGPASGGALSLQIGANSGDKVDVFISTFSTEALGIKELNFESTETAQQAMNSVDKALDITNKQRVELGSYQIRLKAIVDSTSIAIENFKAAESNMRDTDIAEAISELGKQLLSDQVNISMLSQANVQAQSVLRLLS